MWRVAVGSIALSGCSFSPGAWSARDSDVGGDAAADTPREVDAESITPDAAVDAAPPAVTVRRDCLEWFENGVTTSGVKTIDPDGNETGQPAFDAYCDMTTAGGGWTLVWVYGFTSYASFATGANAVTPHPTWGIPANGVATPTSTTVPLAPTTTGALTFARWASLGANVLVASNVNHWVRCAPGTGSLVTMTEGSMTCSVVQAIAATCTTTAPDRFHASEMYGGVGLYAGGTEYDTYYFWEARTATGTWPTHDPCGNNGANHVANAVNPYGSVYLRR